VLATASATSFLIAGIGAGRAASTPAPFATGNPPLVSGLSLSATSGTVGTPVSANGSGFAANAPIALTLGGIPLSSACLSDASGDFPGLTGTACAFTVPAVPGGLELVAASDPGNSSSINVGTNPTGVAYDAGTGQIFVSNYGSNYVSVISDSTGAVVATVGVGTQPYAVAYDGSTGEVYVTNAGSNNVSVISDATDTVVATVNVGATPFGAAYDAGTGEIFVANSGSNNVSVISDSTHLVVAAIPVGGNPVYCAYDGRRGEVFVTNQGTNNVSVLSDTSHTTLASIGVGNNPYGVAYDAGQSEVFVTNFGSNNVSVISDASNTVATSVVVGMNPYAVGYDPTRGAAFVADYSANDVSVINDATLLVTSTVAVGNGPYAVASDTGTGAVYVANLNSNNVSVLASGHRATAPFLVGPKLVLSPGSGPAGTSVAAFGLGFAASAPISLTFSGVAVALNCSSDASGSFPGASGTTCRFTVPTAAKGAAAVSASDGVFVANATYAVTPGLVLSPGRGPAGATVSGLGADFAANATIAFTVGGSPVVSNCSTDATGAFPGLTGAPCTFVVPPGPRGPEPVSASDGTDSADASFTLTAGFSVAPADALVGSTVSAVGADFAPDATVSLSVGGTAVSSSCVTDASGSFPGTTGTPCTFAVPTVPGGPVPVIASDGWNVSAVAVGSEPVGVAFDPSTGEVYVSNYGAGSVTVFAEATNAIVTTVGVGSAPYALTYDAGTGQVFVTNSGSNNVSVIDATTHAVVATVDVGTKPFSAAYDAALGEVFVVNSGSNSVSVISDTNDSVVATVAVGTNPVYVDYDAGLGEIFVTNQGSDNVSVIADATNAVVANVGVGSHPYGVAYDAARSEVFVTNFGSNSVSVISDATNAVVATVVVGTEPYAIAYGPGTGELFVANYGSNNVSFVSDATDTSVDTLAVGSGPYAVAYDPTAGELFVANLNSDNVTVIASGDRVTTVLNIDAGLSVTGSSGSADAGQTVALRATGLGSALPITTLSLGTYPLTCTSATSGTCVGGVLTTNASGAFVAGFVVPIGVASGNYTINVTDSGGATANTTIAVFSDPTVATPTASRASADVGQSVTLRTNASFGSGGYSYAWLGLPAGCSGVLASITCTPTTSGVFSISVRATDSNGVSSTSGALAFSVYDDPVVTTPVATPLSGGVDVGQSVTFSTVPSLGTSMYVAFGWSALPPCEGLGFSGNVTCIVQVAGFYSISVTVTDSNGVTSPTSGSLSFEVLADPVVTDPVPTRSSADVGQSVTFSASASLGAGSLAYHWSGLPAGCTGANTNTADCLLASPGVLTVALNATDGNGFTSTSRPLNFTVYADPTVALASDRTALDVGQTATLTAAASLGTGSYTYAWSGLPVGCSGVASTVSCAPIHAGNFSVVVRVGDSNGVSVDSAAVSLRIAPALTLNVSATPSAPIYGASVLFSANATGGTGALTYLWTFGDGSTSPGAAVTHSFDVDGNYNVTVTVNDSAGAIVAQSIAISVAAPTTVFPAGPAPLWVAILVLAAAAVTLAGFLARKRRRQAAAPPEDLAAVAPLAYEERAGSDASEPANDASSSEEPLPDDAN